jgi:hypothetical protein
MKYETPKLTALTPAINAVQALTAKDMAPFVYDTVTHLYNENAIGYADWED